MHGLQTGGNIPLLMNTSQRRVCFSASVMLRSEPREGVRPVLSHWGSGSHLLLNYSQSDSDLAQPRPSGLLCSPTKRTSCWGCAWGRDGQTKTRRSPLTWPMAWWGRRPRQTASCLLQQPLLSVISHAAPRERLDSMRADSTGLTPSTHSSLERVSLFSVDQTPTCLVPLNTAATTIPLQTGCEARLSD